MLRISRKNPILIIGLVLLISAIFSTKPLVAQDNFSANNPSSYECFERSGALLNITPIQDPLTGIMYCELNGQPDYQPCLGGVSAQGVASCDPVAVLKPLPLNQLEIWFVRGVYSIWTLSLVGSVIGVFIISYQHMVSRNAPEAKVRLRERMLNFLFGLCLVFLAVPILNTTFRLLAVNDSVECYQGLAGGGNNVGIGFQFVFPELCTAPNLEASNVTPNDVCIELQRMIADGRVTPQSIINRQTTGLACSVPNQETPACRIFIGINVVFTCNSGQWVPRIR